MQNRMRRARLRQGMDSLAMGKWQEGVDVCAVCRFLLHQQGRHGQEDESDKGCQDREGVAGLVSSLSSKKKKGHSRYAILEWPKRGEGWRSCVRPVGCMVAGFRQEGKIKITAQHMGFIDG